MLLPIVRRVMALQVLVAVLAAGLLWPLLGRPAALSAVLAGVIAVIAAWVYARIAHGAPWLTARGGMLAHHLAEFVKVTVAVLLLFLVFRLFGGWISVPCLVGTFFATQLAYGFVLLLK